MMEIAQLNKSINEKNFSNIYFFYGDESYLKDFYINKIINSVVDKSFEAFNLFTFKNSITVDELDDSIEQAPVMGEYKVVYLNELNVFKGDAKLRDKIISVTEDIPDFCILIIRENASDGKTKLAKQLEKKACCVQCVYPSDGDMRAFIIREFKKRGKIISPQLAMRVVEECERKMYAVINVIDAVCGYLCDCDEVTSKALDMFIVQSFETVVYNLSEYIVTRQTLKAYETLNKLKLTPSKNPPQTLFSLISRHIMGIYIAYMAQQSGYSLKQTAPLLGNNIREFVVSKYLRQIKNIDVKKLPDIIKFCAENDYKLKNGLISDLYLPIYELIAMFN